MATKEAAEEAAARFIQRIGLDFGGHPTYHGGDGLLVREGVRPRTVNTRIIQHDVYLA